MSTVSTTTSATGTLSLTALGTGIDWKSIVSELTQVSEEELVPYNNEISVYNSQISAWGTISSELGTLQSASTALSSPTALDQYTASVSSNSSVGASSLLTATASSAASTGTYNVVINSVAQKEQVASSDISSDTSALGYSGSFTINGQTVSVSSSDSLQTLQNNINALDSGSSPTGVTASIVQDSPTTYRMVLSNDNAGSTGMSLADVDSGSLLESLGFNQNGAADVIQQGTDASFTVDGMNITSASNTDTSAIPGVTLNLLAASPSTTLTLNVAQDTSGIESTVNSMISAYNNVISSIGAQNTYNSATNTTGGPLFGDPALETLKSQLENTVLSQTSSGTYNSLASIGITIGSGGALSLDQSTFEQALSSDSQAVSDIFQDSGTTNNPLFQYVGGTSSTQSGIYTINLPVPSVGTIDGQLASANGNVWSLSSSTSGANGLMVSYSGSTYPSNAEVTVNRGVGSLFNDLVNSYTDPVTGIITAEDSGMNNSISQLNQQVTETQNNINSQMSTLTSQYEDMNTTVAQLDEQASYLSVQLAAL